jgi:hypothetical protein
MARGQRIFHLQVFLLIPYHHHIGLESQCLLDQQVRIALCREYFRRELIRICCYNFQRLCSDRTGRTEHSDAFNFV